MATRVFDDKGRSGRTLTKSTSRRSRKRAPSRGEPGITVEERLHEAIEIERDQLSKAESLLGCVALSMEYGTESANKPYYPDLVHMARELVRRSINGLDAVALQKYLQRDKVKDEGLDGVAGYVGRLAMVAVRQEQAITMI